MPEGEKELKIKKIFVALNADGSNSEQVLFNVKQLRLYDSKSFVEIIEMVTPEIMARVAHEKEVAKMQENLQNLSILIKWALGLDEEKLAFLLSVEKFCKIHAPKKFFNIMQIILKLELVDEKIFLLWKQTAEENEDEFRKEKLPTMKRFFEYVQSIVDEEEEEEEEEEEGEGEGDQEGDPNDQ